MHILLSVSLATCAVLVLALVLLFRQLGGSGKRLPVTLELIEELSVQRYRPMMRLLDAQDLEYLRSQPGFTPRMARRLRAQRCRIFREYLRCLSSDFARICAALSFVMAQSRQDRPDLAAVLVRSRAQFACGLIALNCRLFLYRWGLCTVDVRSLVKIFDGMRLELRALVPTPMAMSA